MVRVKRLYIGHLSNSARKGDVEDFFKGYGKLLDIHLKEGYGFVEFSDSQDAEEALLDLNNKKICGQIVNLEYAKIHQTKSYSSSRGDYGGRGDYNSRNDYGHRSSYSRGYGNKSFGSGRGYNTYRPRPHKKYHALCYNVPTTISIRTFKEKLQSHVYVYEVYEHDDDPNIMVLKFSSRSDMEKCYEKCNSMEIEGCKIRIEKTNRSHTPGLNSTKSSRSRSRSKISRDHSSSRSRSRSRKSSRSSRSSRSRSRDHKKKKSRSRSFADKRDKKGKKKSKSRSRNRSLSIGKDKRSRSRSRDSREVSKRKLPKVVGGQVASTKVESSIANNNNRNSPDYRPFDHLNDNYRPPDPENGNSIEDLIVSNKQMEDEICQDGVKLTVNQNESVVDEMNNLENQMVEMDKNSKDKNVNESDHEIENITDNVDNVNDMKQDSDDKNDQENVSINNINNDDEKTCEKLDGVDSDNVDIPDNKEVVDKVNVSDSENTNNLCDNIPLESSNQKVDQVAPLNGKSSGAHDDDSNGIEETSVQKTHQETEKNENDDAVQLEDSDILDKSIDDVNMTESAEDLNNASFKTADTTLEIDSNTSIENVDKKAAPKKRGRKPKTKKASVAKSPKVVKKPRAKKSIVDIDDNIADSNIDKNEQLVSEEPVARRSTRLRK